MAWLTPADLRVFDTALADTTVYGEDQLEVVISDVEAELERILGTAYNSRTATSEWHLGDGSEWLRLDNRWPTAISSVTIDGTSVSAGAIADMVIDRSAGRIRYSAGWTDEAPIVITYAYGKTAPPADLKRAAMILCRARLGQTRSPVMDRAERYVQDGGGTLVLSMPSATRTGVPDVDAILARYLIPGIA